MEEVKRQKNGRFPPGVSGNPRGAPVGPRKKKSDLEKVADAIQSVAVQLKHLGLADAATPFGAIEALIVQNDKDSVNIAGSIDDVAMAIVEVAESGRSIAAGLCRIAEVISEKNSGSVF